MKYSIKINFSADLKSFKMLSKASSPDLKYSVPVSYTHLDGYKRQAPKNAAAIMASELTRMAFPSKNTITSATTILALSLIHIYCSLETAFWISRGCSMVIKPFPARSLLCLSILHCHHAGI